MKNRIYTLLVIFAVLVACKKEDSSPKPSPVKNYLLVGNEYYSLKRGYVGFDQTNGVTTSTIWLTDSATNNGFTVDFLMVNDTTALPSGNYEFKKITAVKDMEFGKFHTMAFQYRTNDSTTQISSFNTVITKATMQVKQINGESVIDALVEYNGKTAKVHFEGTLEYLKFW